MQGDNNGGSNNAGGVVRMGKNVQIGGPYPSNDYNVALNIAAAEKVGLFVSSSSTSNPYNYGIVSAVGGEINKAFAVILNLGSSNSKESITLQGNGAATFGGNGTVMPTLYVTPSVVNNQYVNGNVGIGTNTPNASLDIKTISNTKPFNIFNGVLNKNIFEVLSDGTTHIGTSKQTGTHTDAMLTVDGKIVARAAYVRAGDWADYVFDKSYKLMPLSEVEKYYTENKHLPEIPSEKEVIEKGIDLGEMNKLLLKKIEELTIRMVDQEKRIKELENCR